jgi:hypothetical protein
MRLAKRQKEAARAERLCMAKAATAITAPAARNVFRRFRIGNLHEVAPMVTNRKRARLNEADGGL